MDQNGINSETLARFISGEADAQERLEVERWAAHSDANADELRRLRLVWSLSGDAMPVPGIDEERAWLQLQARIAEAEGSGRVLLLGRVRWQRWAAAAAVVAGVLFAARWWSQPSTEHFAAEAGHEQVLLADGSSLVLSPGSEIEAQLGRERRIGLNGEAYFAVQRDEERPFVVSAGDVEVTVLGTEFTVAGFDTADLVEVRVRSGRVQVAAGADTVVLGSGEHARYSKSRHLIERVPAPPSAVWGWRILHFDRAPLQEVSRQLERIYQVRVALAHAGIARCTLTAEFDDEPIESILSVIADTFGLTVVRDGNDYTLDGTGC